MLFLITGFALVNSISSTFDKIVRLPKKYDAPYHGIGEQTDESTWDYANMGSPFGKCLNYVNPLTSQLV